MSDVLNIQTLKWFNTIQTFMLQYELPKKFWGTLKKSLSIHVNFLAMI